MKISRDYRGFTLVELIVVVLIVGILAAFGIPQYVKTVESTKADEAIAMVNMIGTTNKMFALDHAGCYASGQFASNCDGAACPPGPWVPCPAVSPCALVACKYLAQQDFMSKPYTLSACDGAAPGACETFGAGDNNVAGAKRKATASAPYNGWGYTMTRSGVVHNHGQAPPATSQY